MPRTHLGTEYSDGTDSGGRSSERARAIAVLRGIGFAVAIALGAVSVWLIVTSDSLKTIRIGALAGFWGLLVGGFSVFGRHASAPSVGLGVTAPGQGLDVRSNGSLERAQDVAERRDFEARLVQLLRHEVQATMASELGQLSRDVADLRTELLDKVGGQLRTERIETTRIFGSDIEALQNEINQLKQSRSTIDVEPGRLPAPAPLRYASVTPVAPTPTPDPTPEPVSLPVPAPAPLPTPEPARLSIPDPVSMPLPTAEPMPMPAPVAVAQPVVATVSPPRPEPAPGSAFAGLPRLEPFTDFDLEPVSRPAVPPPWESAPAEEVGSRSSARHADGTIAPTPTGGRRRRESTEQNDVLARILAREQAR